MEQTNDIFDFATSAYLVGSKSIVSLLEGDESLNLTTDKNVQTLPITPKSGGGKTFDFVPWGANNKLPMTLLAKAFRNVTVGANLEFNTRLTYGDGLMVVKKQRQEDGTVQFQEVLPSEEPSVFAFLEENNYNRQLQELANDFSVFYDSFVELTFNNDKKSPQIVRLEHKEMCYSRITKVNEQGIIEHHGYSAYWAEKGLPQDVVVTPLLKRSTPITDLKERIKSSTARRFMLSVALPTPGRFYYNKPYWWSIFESGWFDFACAIPEFKRALIRNQMAVKFHVKINTTFFDRLFKSEKIIEPDKQKARRVKFYKQLDEFLSGAENAGKSFVSSFGYDLVKGTQLHDILIEPIKSEMQGGEYIDDSEEASNIICYAMGVHPSIIGASPGKNKTISGSEARELFIIKQSMMKPIRDMLLAPLYVIKALNGWNPDIHFIIPNIMLTTLDNGTGAAKSIGNKKI